jgi:hypothetical protein
VIGKLKWGGSMTNEQIDRGIEGKIKFNEGSIMIIAYTKVQELLPMDTLVRVEAIKGSEDICIPKEVPKVCGVCKKKYIECAEPDPIRQVYEKWKDKDKDTIVYVDREYIINIADWNFASEMWSAIKKYCEGE